MNREIILHVDVGESETVLVEMTTDEIAKLTALLGAFNGVLYDLFDDMDDFLTENNFPEVIPCVSFNEYGVPTCSFKVIPNE